MTDRIVLEPEEIAGLIRGARLLELREDTPPETRERLLATAETLGAGRAQRFSLVYFPMSLPGITVSSALVFVYAIGAFAIPAVLGGQKGTMVSVTIYQQVNETFAYGVASALSVLTMIAVTVVLVLLLRLMRGSLLWVIDPQSIAERSVGRTERQPGPGSTVARHTRAAPGAGGAPRLPGPERPLRSSRCGRGSRNNCAKKCYE